jgi:hypothetical protein
MKMMLRYFIIPIAVFTSGILSAQNTMSIEAVGQVSPVTKDSVRRIIQSPTTKDTVLPAPAFTYSLQNKRFMTTVAIDTIKSAKLGAEPVQKLYRTYARMGIGNYGMLLGEFSVGSLRSKTGAWGAHVSHWSAGSGPKNVAGQFSGFSHQDVNIFGKRFLKQHTLYGGFDYDRDVVYNYGSVSSVSSFSRDATRQRYNYFGVNAALHSHLTASDAIHHQITARYYHLYDRYKTNEDNIKLDVALGRFIREQRVDFFTGVDFNRNSGPSDSVANTILHFRPMFSSHGNKFDVAIGIGVAVDINSEEALTTFYPQFEVSYDIINHILVPYLTLGGGLERTSFRTLSLANPFVMSNQAFTMLNTQRKYDLRAGLRGSISSEIAYDLRASRVELVNAPFYVNTISTQDIFQNKFAVVYDQVDLYQIHGQISWQHFEKYRLLVTGDFYKYEMTNEEKPWHTPALRLGLTSEYNLEDKILARANVYYLSGQYAKVFDGTNYTTVTLKGLVDVNMAFEYRYTEFLSVFLNLNNIASQRYNRWYAYPTQKFNMMAGLTYTF